MHKHDARLFVYTGALAIVAGGLLSAFSAHNPSFVTSWSAAYLVLVVGAFQVVVGLAIYSFVKGRHSMCDIYWSFGLFNLGNFAVISGTVLKHTFKTPNLLIALGGLFIVIVMVLFVRLIPRGTKNKYLVVYYLLIAFVAASVAVGLALSARNL